MKEKYIVDGMSCEACKLHVEKAVKKIDGVENVSVNLLTKEMVVESNSSLSNIVNKEVSKIGYKSHLKDDTKKEDVKDENTKNKLYSTALENSWTKRVLDLDKKIQEIRKRI